MTTHFESRTILLFVVVLVAFVFSSCALFQRQDASRTTGWALGDTELGEFGRTDFREQDPGPGMVFIEGGSFLMGRTEEDVMREWNNIPRTVSVASFYMDETEITNFEYREYLHWLNRVFRPTLPEVYNAALPDTLVWRDPLAYNDPLIENYLRHPAFDDYPVVGVSWVQAANWASWRTDRVNEWLLYENGYIVIDLDDQRPNNHFTTVGYLAGHYDGLVRDDLQRRVRWEDGLLVPRYRLPTEAEWEFAALGLIGNTIDDMIINRRTYPWDGTNVRQSDRRNRGELKANFQRGPGNLAGIAGSDNPGSGITMPVYSFMPNDYGLYNMAGNVNEWVKDVYRPLSHETVADFRPFRGNVFKIALRDDDGNLIFDDQGNVQYQEMETDENGITARDYRQGSFVDYRDGDQMSAIEGHEVYPREQTLISNQARVYKGGGWRDRVYWLSPGNRRFLDENKSANDIGFRCAMDKIGGNPY